MSQRKLTDAQIVAAVAACEDGEKITAVARRFGIATQTVSWHCLIAGVAFSRIYADRGPMMVMRAGRPVRRFTPAEDALIQHLSMACQSYHAIARALAPPRTPNSVKARLATLARRDGLDEERNAA